MDANSLLIRCLALLPSGAAGLVSLADVQALQKRAALAGTSGLIDSFMICPGVHKLQNSPELSKGEYPACAAMTTGYVFRVENEATVFQLQRLGRPGHLTTLKLSNGEDVRWSATDALQWTAFAMTFASIMALGYLQDHCALAALGILLLIRTTNVVIFRSRSQMGWKGAPEPGVKGDLIVLLSQDRWIRIRGLVDDIKAVTSGQWLRAMTFSETALISCCKVLQYSNAALMWEASKAGQMILLLLLLATAALLGVSNESAQVFHMYGRSIRPEGSPKAYDRRLDLAEYLIKETSRDDWAVRLGMIQPRSSDMKAESELGAKIM